MGRFGSSNHFFITRIQFAIANIFHGAGGKDDRLLRNDADQIAQLANRPVGNVPTQNCNLASRRCIKAQEHRKQGTFTSARWAYQGIPSALGHGKRQVIDGHKIGAG